MSPSPALRSESTRAVVAEAAGVLVARRRDGMPLWVFPGGEVESGESPAQAVARECFEETGLKVGVEREIGRRNYPVTGQRVVYLECTLATAAGFRAPSSSELAELRWLDPTRSRT